MKRRNFLYTVATGAAACTAIARGEVLDRPPMVTPQAERAIERGTAYLARVQAQDGSWAGGSNNQQYPTTMTAVGGLALMAAGNTPQEGKYAKNVRRAVDFILRASSPSGLLTNAAFEARPMYGHGYGMLFLAQAYGAEPDVGRQRRLRSAIEAAVRLTAKSQSKAGGWMYTPDSGGDEGSVTITQIQGLRAARNAGIKVPKSVIDRACEYVAECANSDGGISYSLSSRGRSLAPITAASVATMYNAGQYEHPVAKGALEFTLKQLRDHDFDVFKAYRSHTYYALFYVAQGMYLSGDENWKKFFPKCRDGLIARQSDDGSWNDNSTGGPIFATATALITLLMPYGNMPILQR